MKKISWMSTHLQNMVIQEYLFGLFSILVFVSSGNIKLQEPLKGIKNIG